MYEVDRIGVAYGKAPALWEVSIRIEPGELVAVIGPNGAGKTTLINTMAGINRVTSGALRIDGRDATRLGSHRFCEAGVALVPEARRLFTRMTVRENLELGAYRPGAHRGRAEALAEAFRLFPVLEERLDQLAGTLSGGQQQMVAIARALMAGPRYLLLDEPSLGLSPAVTATMLQAIGAINARGIAVLLVEQNVAAALAMAARAYVLEEGRIVTEGPPATLLAEPHIRRAYLGEG